MKNYSTFQCPSWTDIAPKMGSFPTPQSIVCFRRNHADLLQPPLKLIIGYELVARRQTQQMLRAIKMGTNICRSKWTQSNPSKPADPCHVWQMVEMIHNDFALIFRGWLSTNHQMLVGLHELSSWAFPDDWSKNGSQAERHSTACQRSWLRC